MDRSTRIEREVNNLPESYQQKMAQWVLSGWRIYLGRVSLQTWYAVHPEARQGNGATRALDRLHDHHATADPAPLFSAGTLYGVLQRIEMAEMLTKIAP